MSNIVNGSLVPTGKFVTITFFTKSGDIRKLNGRTGVNKYSKGGKPTVDLSKFFIVYTRKGSIKFDAPRVVNKNSIISIRASGIKAEKNVESAYASTL